MDFAASSTRQRGFHPAPRFVSTITVKSACYIALRSINSPKSRIAVFQIVDVNLLLTTIMRPSFILLAAFSADFVSINEPLSTIGISIFE